MFGINKNAWKRSRLLKVLPIFVSSALIMGHWACSKSKSDNSDDGDNTTATTTTVTVDSTLTMVASNTVAPSTKTSSHTDPYYFAPFPFITILQYGFTPTLSDAVEPVNRSRYLLKSALGNYLTTDESGNVSTSTALATYSDTMRKTFQFLSDGNGSGGYRLDSELHSNLALDSSANGTLMFSNNRGNAATPASRGYITLSYDKNTKLMQAKARYLYDLSTYTSATSSDSSFTALNFYLKDTGSTFVLTASSADATQFTLKNTPIDVSMPSDFNPDSIAYQTNGPVPIKDYVTSTTSEVEGTNGKVYKDLASAYRSQANAVGDDTGTATAAEAMLTTIESTLKSENASLRYPKALYLAFRKAALNTKLASHSIANGTYGMNTVPYVYFTNEADSSGVHHPFMVMATYSISDKPNRLQDVNRPPGDGTTAGYATQKVTRDATIGLDLVKIPLRNYGEVSALTDNTLVASLNSDEGNKVENNVFNYASTSGVGVAVDGVIIYPILNNTLATTHSSAEITSTGIHVGQGMGLHYHADGHTVHNNDMNLYNMADYPGQSHPPILGFGLDGIALFGIYESLYPTMEGYSSGLDTYGGHSHGDLGYHYHAHTYSATTNSGKAYTVHALMRGAWKGKINSIPEFWDANKGEPAYSMAQKHVYVGKY